MINVQTEWSQPHDIPVLIFSENQDRSFIYSSIGCFVGFMMFNATFNNISVISWQLVLFVKETGGPGENHKSQTNFII
jgi:hypothetical protein